MRILSEVHDYYDVVQAQGQDLKMVWVRKPETVALERGSPDHWGRRASNWPFPVYFYQERFRRSKIGPTSTSWYIVGFCGKIYPVFKFQTKYEVGVKPVICFNLQQIDEYVESNFKEAAFYEYKLKIPKRKTHWWKYRGRMKHWPSDLLRDKFEEFFVRCEEEKIVYEKMFLDKRCPVFIADSNDPLRCTITYNAVLKDLEFFRMFDPFTAFQEIAMYFGNMAVPLNPIPSISDRNLSEAKGFDKFSFRKEKSK